MLRIQEKKYSKPTPFVILSIYKRKSIIYSVARVYIKKQGMSLVNQVFWIWERSWILISLLKCQLKHVGETKCHNSNTRKRLTFFQKQIRILLNKYVDSQKQMFEGRQKRPNCNSILIKTNGCTTRSPHLWFKI